MTTSPRPTPLCYAFKHQFDDDRYAGANIEKEWEEFARTLERALAAEKEKVGELVEALFTFCPVPRWPHSDSCGCATCRARALLLRLDSRTGER